MNIFDVGGITTTIAVIVTLLVGTGIFIAINTIFECWYFGIGAMITEWVVCCIVGAFIVNFLAGLVGGIFSIIWFLIKSVALIGIIGAGGMFIYSKLSGKQEDESKGNE